MALLETVKRQDSRWFRKRNSKQRRKLRKYRDVCNYRGTRGIQMINIPNFYPTPQNLIRKMLEGINLEQICTILEPSAGKGDIVDYITNYIKSNEWKFRYHKLNIDTIEIDSNLQHILKGKGYRVVHNDFLSFETFKSYDLIIMNPPFSDGDKHLLKALDLMKNGGHIVCLLNSMTIKHPFSNIRKDLMQRLDELNANIEFIPNAFIDAERTTAVEIALIKVNIPAEGRTSILIDELRKTEIYKQALNTTGEIIEKDFLNNIVQRYNFEMKAGLNLLNEYFAMKPYILTSFKEVYNNAVIELKVGGSEKEPEFWNSYIQAIRSKYWKALFNSEVFANVFTTKLRNEFHSRIDELQHYDFSLYNIYTIKTEILKGMSKSIDDTILALFEEFSHKHHWYNETSKNIHYYNGWKTNQCWKINKRVIIPLSAYSWGEFRPNYSAGDKLKDIEKVFDYLDDGQSDHVDLEVTLKRAQEAGQTTKIPLKYFNVTFYKKGTCHIEFANPDLLKKFNLFGSQKKGWLPPSYGKADYDDMAQEEKTVIDSYEGEAEYRKVMKNKDYFLCKVGLPLLEAS